MIMGNTVCIFYFVGMAGLVMALSAFQCESTSQAVGVTLVFLVVHREIKTRSTMLGVIRNDKPT